VPLSRQAVAILERVKRITGNRRYVLSGSDDEPLSPATLNARLRSLGVNTKNDHCAHGFRTTFSMLCHHEEHKEHKAWDGDVIELQLAHLESSTVKAIYKRHGAAGADWSANQADAALGGPDRQLVCPPKKVRSRRHAESL
jgi:integrase